MERAEVRANVARAAFYVFVFAAGVSLEAWIVAMFVSIWVHARFISNIILDSGLSLAICFAGAVLSSQLIDDYDNLSKHERRSKDAPR